MSLFKAKEFWRTSDENEERYDHNSLKISHLNGEYDYIITGSHSGKLKIFQPASEIAEDSVLSGYKPTDLLLEKLFDLPILQLDAGKLVSGSKATQLAILQPRCVGVYNLINKEGNTDHGRHSSLSLMYEHKLRRSSKNFVIGPFGGSQNRDFMCIQSLDGMLTFFEQESFTFCCFLPDFLIPGVLVYNKSSDSFITSTSNWNIESYSYKRLSECEQNTEQNGKSVEKIVANWSYNFGEAVVDMNCMSSSSKESCILILGERNLCSLNENGSIVFMKRFDYLPSCFSAYYLEDKLITLVISEANTLLIYEKTTVKWATQLLLLPIAIGRVFTKNVPGAICMLGEDGVLQLCYLGTEPSLFTAPPVINKELDFQKAEVELATLIKMIKSSQATDVNLTDLKSEEELRMTITVNPHLQDNVISNNAKLCMVNVDILPQAVFEEVHLSFFVQSPLKVAPQTAFITNLYERTQLACSIYLEDLLDIPSLEMEVNVSYISKLGAPRILNESIILPMNLVLKSCAPIKESQHKLTLNINKANVPLHLLFPEFVGENSLGVNSNAIGFKGFKEISEPVTILLAKSSQRYRLQSDSLIAMNIMVKEMVRRLHQNCTDDDFAVSLGSLPAIPKILEYVRNHFEARKFVTKYENELGQLNAQFRVVQKRLISKFKDKTPTPLLMLEMLLKDTYSEIVKATAELQEWQVKLLKSRVELSCAINLVLHSLSLMDVQKDFAAFETVFSSYINDLEGQSWEDTTDAALCYILRTFLAKSDKDRLRAAHSSFDEVKDLTKFEKHFSTVIERLLKKGPLMNINERDDTYDVKENQVDSKVELVPIGNQFGESSSRALSSRRSLLQRRNKVMEEN